MFRNSAAGRDMAAWLCRRWSGATLRDLGTCFGLEGTDSVSNLARRAEIRYNESSNWRRQANRNRTWPEHRTQSLTLAKHYLAASVRDRTKPSDNGRYRIVPGNAVA